MLRYIIRRLGYLIFVLLLTSFILFGIYKLVPGDTAALMLEGQQMSVSPDVYDQMYEQMRETLGLDENIIVQYVKWLFNTVQGDLGYSTQARKPVNQVIMVPMLYTIRLNLLTMFLVFSITIPLGITTAVRKYTTYDNIVQVASVIGYSIPTFILALVFIILFSVNTDIFPISGSATAGSELTGFADFVDKLYHMALPIIVMTISSLGGITRYVRGAMIECLQADYIRTARAKGLKEKVVIYVHAFRNSLIPLVTIVTGWLISLFGGSVVIETVFNLNGMGNLLVTSLRQLDFFVSMAIQIFYVLLVLLGNLIMDIGYSFVDPRIKLG